MLDRTTGQRMKVSINSLAGPYISVPATQLREVRQVLDAAEIQYWADAIAVSVDGRPALTVINLGKGVDASHIQSILDRAA